MKGRFKPETAEKGQQEVKRSIRRETLVRWREVTLARFQRGYRSAGKREPLKRTHSQLVEEVIRNQTPKGMLPSKIS